ncbi:diguanylate cyclase [Undibacterium flavidum]|uniref:diguanylate cyclase n=1 Tax=Undibacterium flavidum TaxID=2762297 RepID=A0ABR6YCI8_9BURK|nr:diguanylate cyclase [Undibacterium flavidum]MBC3874247.1 diguanylate cyclase [Undibacterium flavidum]
MMPLDNTNSRTSNLRVNRNILLIAIVVAIISVSGLTYFAALYLYQQAQVQTEVTTRNLARSIEQNISEVVGSIDQALLNTSDEFARQQSTGKINDHQLNLFMQRQLRRHEHLAYILATNERGDVVYGSDVLTTRNNIADRDYFIALRDNSDADVLLTRLLLGRIYKKWVWIFVRRLNKQDGRFAGVVFAGIFADKLGESFSKYQLDRGDSIVLRDADLGIIARQVFGRDNTFLPTDKTISEAFRQALKSSPMGATYASGASSIDGVNRTHSFRRNEKYGFIVNVGVSGEHEFLQWRRLALIGLVLVGFFVIAASAFAWLLLRSWYAHERNLDGVLVSQRALAESEEKFHSLFCSMSEGVALHRLIRNLDGKAIDYEIIEVNPSFVAQTGLSRELVVGKSASQVYNLEVAPFLDKYVRVAEGGEAIQFEECFEQLEKDFLIHVSSPKLDHFATVFEDITERKKWQKSQSENLQKLELQYQQIVKLQEQLMLQVLRDPLTGLHNRRFMDEALMKELARAKRENYSLSLIMLDLDFFKRVNDTYGHAVGDQVLITLSKHLRAHARESDIVCRYGGEEFLVAMPHMTPEQAFRKIDSLRQIIAQTPVMYGSIPISITISAGVASFPENGDDIDALLRLADNAMYQSKHDGRNRVSLSK